MTNEDPKTEAPTATPVRGPTPAVETATSTLIGQVYDLVTRHWPLLALLSSALMLAIAHSFETFGHLAPCHLCLKAREVYWVAGTVGLIGVVLQRTSFGPRLRQPVNLLLAAIFLYGTGLAVFHAGVEWKWWPGPSTCTGSGAASAANLSAMLNGTMKIKPPMCDKAAWVFLGLSMAGWNALVSLKLTVWSVLSGLRKAETL